MTSDLARMKFLTAPLPADMEEDIWDDEFCLSYSKDGTKLLDAENFSEEVTVKDGCRIICDEVFAFQDYMSETCRLGEEPPEEERVSYLCKITLPDSITHIGEGAFRECGGLSRLRFPKSLVYIGPEAFQDCFSLHRITLPKGLRYIGDHAFFCCDELEEIKLPLSVEYIGGGAFNGCDSLECISIPKGSRHHFQTLFPGRFHRLFKEI